MNENQETCSPEPLLIDLAGVSKMCGISVRTLHRMRDDGRLPRPLRLGDGKLIRWAIADIVEWVEKLRAEANGGVESGFQP